MRTLRFAAVAAAALLLLTGCSTAASDADPTATSDASASAEPQLEGELTVFAAASLKTAFDELASYGLGPHECPPDRVEGAVLGRYRRLASEEHSPYVVPQCFGQRSGTRWLSAAAPERGALVISAEQPFVHTAHRYSDGQLTRALHADELKPEDAVFVHLDAAHRGVGTASCGPDAAARHLIRAGRHQLSLTLSWVEPGAERSDGSGQ